MRKGFKKVFKRWPPRDFCVSLEVFAFREVIPYGPRGV
jgi:hypothetical protein